MTNLPNKSSNNSLINQDQFASEANAQKSQAKGLLNKKLTMLQRIFPNSEEKVAKAHVKNILEQEAKSELEKHRMANEFFTQALQATFDDVLTRGVVKIQTEQSRDFVKVEKETIQEINQLMMEFYEQMARDEERILQMPNKRLRDRQFNMLDDRYTEFERTVQHLMQKLEDATKKTVGRKD